MTLTIPRGNTVSFTIDTGDYALQSGETLVFSVRKESDSRTRDDPPIIQKTFDSGGVITFEKADTEQLLGTFYYDVTLVSDDGTLLLSLEIGGETVNQFVVGKRVY